MAITSTANLIAQGARIPVTNPSQKVKSGLAGKYSYEKAWKQATTYDTRTRMERDPRWKDYFAKKAKQREAIIEKSKQPGPLASERFLTEEVDGMRMTPEQARAFKQKKADTAYEMETGIDAGAFRDLLKKENIEKAKKEYLAQLPPGQNYAQTVTETKYGGTFSDARGSGFDQWFNDNYLSKIKKSDTPSMEKNVKTYTDLLKRIEEEGKAQLLPGITAPKENYLSRGKVNYLPTTPEAAFNEIWETKTKSERKDFLKDLSKEAPVFASLSAFGTSPSSKKLESFLSGGARKSQIFGPAAFQSAFGSGLGKSSSFFTMNNYPTYGRSV